ncbi:hypothetical protein GGI12_002033 [Dipsacomyces acuminosporus]|nr:hypothetical protein GGI12_002033 [Dipsacomyces acuminosporus]
MPAPATLFHTGAHLQKGLPPTRDGDELSQPLEPADVRTFWSNLGQETRDGKASASSSVSQGLNVPELRGLLSTIIHKEEHKGDVMMSLYTQRCCELYEALDGDARKQFIQTLASEFCAPKGNSQEAARKYLASASQSQDPAQSALEARELRDCLTPQYTELFDQINRLPGGFSFLVHMRADILRYIQKNRSDAAARAMSDVLMNKLQTVNWRGNTSYSGLRQSLGLMCNYNYMLNRIEDNNERYVRDGAIAVSGSDPYIAAAKAASSNPQASKAKL